MTGHPDAGRLLGDVDAALSACEASGVAVRLRHGILETRAGYR